ncbi:MAG TPA: hypothetical protein VL400_17685, partial [Polyangiaceae bacterium]|nr:hypothetical protein [Polyangiaceae bacterium]
RDVEAAPRDVEAAPRDVETAPRDVEAAPRPAPDRPRRGSDVLPLFSLRPIRFVALLAVVTMVVARGVLPALRGAVVGISELIDSIDVVAGTLSQLLAFVLVGLIATELWDVARARSSLGLKVTTIVLCPPLVVVAILSVAMTRPPAEMSLALSAVAGTLVAVLGLDAAREPSTRSAAWIPVLVGVASTIRGGGAYIAERSQELARDVESISRAFAFARVGATVAAALAGIALILGLVWLARHDRRLYGVRALLAVGISLLVSRAAATAIDDTTATWQVVTRRAAQELLTRPTPHLPEAVLVFAAVLPVALAIALLTLRRAVPAITSSIAMMVLVGPSADIPLLSLVAIAGVLALWLASKDPRGVWAALQAAKPMAPHRREPAPAEVAKKPADGHAADRRPADESNASES